MVRGFTAFTNSICFTDYTSITQHTSFTPPIAPLGLGSRRSALQPLQSTALTGVAFGWQGNNHAWLLCYCVDRTALTTKRRCNRWQG